MTLIRIDPTEKCFMHLIIEEHCYQHLLDESCLPINIELSPYLYLKLIDEMNEYFYECTSVNTFFYGSRLIPVVVKEY